MSHPKPRILFFNPVRHALDEYEALKSVANPEVVTSSSRAKLFDDLRTKYHDIEAIFRTSSTGTVAGKFDEEFVNQLPASLKYICHTGAGYDQIDVDACTQRNIFVTFAPDPVTNAILAMAAALDEGHIAAVGLDIYEKEPLVDERLVKNDRALLVPHLGTHTVETLGQMENARRGVCGERLLTVVPEQTKAYEQYT
ncbi:hypothetical protein CSAL01_00735 [Colletotrichum salicis]|uniref:D-isomer specific 2-hydroxyacid dehydrogenase catalytic domain-containing protein n=1 Tax=Colletotrichum salicis TaxID=1209931 RepID=A0A135RVJ4_9PEZI|nr:hypothetical protein CSAL01_00735 [Colletotrichum salicis]